MQLYFAFIFQYYFRRTKVEASNYHFENSTFTTLFRLRERLFNSYPILQPTSFNCVVRRWFCSVSWVISKLFSRSA